MCLLSSPIAHERIQPLSGAMYCMFRRGGQTSLAVGPSLERRAGAQGAELLCGLVERLPGEEVGALVRLSLAPGAHVQESLWNTVFWHFRTRLQIAEDVGLVDQVHPLPVHVGVERVEGVDGRVCVECVECIRDLPRKIVW